MSKAAKVIKFLVKLSEFNGTDRELGAKSEVDAYKLFFSGVQKLYLKLNPSKDLSSFDNSMFTTLSFVTVYQKIINAGDIFA
jgi:hypothetical protein